MGIFQPHEFPYCTLTDLWLSINCLFLNFFLKSYCLPEPEETFMGMAKSHNEKNPSPFCHSFASKWDCSAFPKQKKVLFCFFLLNVKANIFSCYLICRSTETSISTVFHIKNYQNQTKAFSIKSSVQTFGVQWNTAAKGGDYQMRFWVM